MRRRSDTCATVTPAPSQRAPGAGGGKFFAAWLFEAAGFEGLREGDASISTLALVDHGKATGAELWALAQQVIAGVQAKFGLRLEPEPVVIGA